MWTTLKGWLDGLLGKNAVTKAHMTFARTSMGNRIKQTSLILRRQIWIWPIIAVILLTLIGYTITRRIQLTMEGNLEAQLNTLLSVERAMVEKWLRQQESAAITLANDHNIREQIGRLVEFDSPLPGTPVAESKEQDKIIIAGQLARELGPSLSANDFSGYLIATRENKVIAGNNPELIGQTMDQYKGFLSKVFDGKATVCPPFKSIAAVKDSAGKIQTGVPTMFVAVPIKDENLQIIAALCLRIRPEKEFTRIVQLGKFGQSGETLAFDATGTLVSNSRFDDDLILLGLIQDKEGASSILNLQLKNPGGDMTKGFRPKRRRAELPLTKDATGAIAGNDGVDLAGFPDYRGVPVVGAWTWLKDYDFGLAIEIDHEEAFLPLNILKRAFYLLYALLTLSALAIFVFTLIVTRLQREAREAAIEAKQLGQYRLDEKLGEGAMGIVYRGHHAMLRRPSAIKLLHADRVNESSIARFEQEVQITCNLNNPHTVAIYDYGRTPEGVFYYAMEYLDGIDLQNLVDRYGPQPDGRVAKILDQLCSSLFEAHSTGLVHRDIKPANIMLNRRGGVPDFVKLLDFGLVRAVDDAKKSKQAGGGMAGTPLYMSPESIQTPDLVDARSDLYAVGAVGYFLLTGHPVFEAKTLVELCQQHVDAIPVPPSERLGREVDQELEHAVMACLEKNRAKRPQTARDLAALIHRLSYSDAWSINDADGWWSRHDRSNMAVSDATKAALPAVPPLGRSGAGSLGKSANPLLAQPDRKAATATQGFDQTIEITNDGKPDGPKNA